MNVQLHLRAPFLRVYRHGKRQGGVPPVHGVRFRRFFNDRPAFFIDKLRCRKEPPVETRRGRIDFPARFRVVCRFQNAARLNAQRSARLNRASFQYRMRLVFRRIQLGRRIAEEQVLLHDVQISEAALQQQLRLRIEGDFAKAPHIALEDVVEDDLGERVISAAVGVPRRRDHADDAPVFDAHQQFAHARLGGRVEVGVVAAQDKHEREPVRLGKPANAEVVKDNLMRPDKPSAMPGVLRDHGASVERVHDLPPRRFGRLRFVVVVFFQMVG